MNQSNSHLPQRTSSKALLKHANLFIFSICDVSDGLFSAVVCSRGFSTVFVPFRPDQASLQASRVWNWTLGSGLVSRELRHNLITNFVVINSPSVINFNCAHPPSDLWTVIISPNAIQTVLFQRKTRAEYQERARSRGNRCFVPQVNDLTSLSLYQPESRPLWVWMLSESTPV